MRTTHTALLLLPLALLAGLATLPTGGALPGNLPHDHESRCALAPVVNVTYCDFGYRVGIRWPGPSAWSWDVSNFSGTIALRASHALGSYTVHYNIWDGNVHSWNPDHEGVFVDELAGRLEVFSYGPGGNGGEGVARVVVRSVA